MATTFFDKGEMMNKKKWLMLSAVSVGLLLIPRRSSRHSTQHLSKNGNESEKPDKNAIDIKGDVNQKYNNNES